ncbi:MAG: polysaccharide pyruvyl transferase family protein [Roseburia sp.]|nr:polysaccharide pyruvyl transferase family protein [Roseburia sp.]
MKKYILISGFNAHDNNRGTAALSYGSLIFCVQQKILRKNQELLNFVYVNKFWKKKYKNRKETYNVDGDEYIRNIIHVSKIEKKLYDKFHVILPFTSFGKFIHKIEIVACINGGDGFSDIYSTKTFFSRLVDTELAIQENIPVIQLPQTLGPFKHEENYEKAKQILQYSKKVFVRDDKFIHELEKMDVNYEMAKDLSAFMQLEPWDIDIKPDSIGINISGLCYSNSFRTLSGQFEMYPKLIKRLICHFQKKGKTVYLIPHSYNYDSPEESNDDMVACRQAYESLLDKNNVVFIDKNLISPQIKYVISKMSFFCGTRMHANFAAIYTGVPLFGLAYSYKFAGAFNANGLDGNQQTAIINNIKEGDIDGIIMKIDNFYNLIADRQHKDR